MDRVENLIHDNGTWYKGTYFHFELWARCAICGIFTLNESKAQLGNRFGMSLEFELGINYVGFKRTSGLELGF